MKSKLIRLFFLFFAISLVQSIAIIGLYIKVARLTKPEEIVVTGLENRIKAPDFSLNDTSGNKISISDFYDREVLLMFASTKCHACIAMFPKVEKFANLHSDLDVVIIISGSDDEVGNLEQMYEFGNSLLLWDSDVQKNYKVKATPYFYAINPDGIIIGSGVANSLEQLEDLISVDAG